MDPGGDLLHIECDARFDSATMEFSKHSRPEPAHQLALGLRFEPPFLQPCQQYSERGELRSVRQELWMVKAFAAQKADGFFEPLR